MEAEVLGWSIAAALATAALVAGSSYLGYRRWRQRRLRR
jgi:membrane protein implicated in regulation of membrane protease activity